MRIAQLVNSLTADNYDLLNEEFNATYYKNDFDFHMKSISTLSTNF